MRIGANHFRRLLAAVAALCLPRRSFAKAGERRGDEGKLDSSAVIDGRYSFDKTANSNAAAFSLVELTLALGVAAFCLLAVFGLMPVGVQTNRNASSQTRATSMTAAVMADLRATPKTAGTWTGTSAQFCIALGTAKKLFFDSEGRCSSDLAGTTKPCPGGAWVPALQTRYRATITWSASGSTGLLYADVKVTWPAPVDPTTTTPSGSAEMFAAFDRN